MRTVSQQIGWSQEAKLLYEIQRELDYVYNITWNVVNTTTTTTINSIQIGTQIWALNNLDVTTYKNGDPIPEVTDPTEWANLTTGAWCWNNNNSANDTVYGRLYNAYAVNDPRGLAPEGWHVPIYDDINTLITSLIVDNNGGNLKETGTSHWRNPNTGATNSSGFTALPGGYRNSSDGSFNYINRYGFWWINSPFGPTEQYGFNLNYTDASIDINHYNNNFGFSVRLIKD